MLLGVVLLSVLGAAEATGLLLRMRLRHLESGEIYGYLQSNTAAVSKLIWRLGRREKVAGLLPPHNSDSMNVWLWIEGYRSFVTDRNVGEDGRAPWRELVAYCRSRGGSGYFILFDDSGAVVTPVWSLDSNEPGELLAQKGLSGDRTQVR